MQWEIFTVSGLRCSTSSITPSRHEMFWTHWNLSAFPSFSLAASNSETGLYKVVKCSSDSENFLKILRVISRRLGINVSTVMIL
jgi:hypothetical protein